MLKRHRPVALAALLLVTAALAALPGVATAAATLTLDPASGLAGRSVLASGSGYIKDRTVEIHWDSATGAPLKSTTADGGGSFSTSFNVPSGASAGDHVVYACTEYPPNYACDGSAGYVGASAKFTVTVPPTTTKPPSSTSSSVPRTTTTAGAGTSTTSSSTSTSTTSTTAPSGPAGGTRFVGFDPDAGIVGPGLLGRRATVLPLGDEPVVPEEGFVPRCEPPPQATVVDFDDVAAGTDVRERYADAGLHLEAGSVSDTATFVADSRPLPTEDATGYGTISAPNAVHLANNPELRSGGEAVRLHFDIPQRLIGLYTGEPDDWGNAQLVLSRATVLSYSSPASDFASQSGRSAVTTCMLVVLDEPVQDMVLRTLYTDSDLRLDRVFFSEDPAYAAAPVTEGFMNVTGPRGREIDVTDPLDVTGYAGPVRRPGDRVARRVDRVRITYVEPGRLGFTTREAEVTPPTGSVTSSAFRLTGVRLPEGVSRVAISATGPGVTAFATVEYDGFTPESRRRAAEGRFDIEPLGIEVTQGIRGPIFPLRPGARVADSAVHVGGRATVVRGYARLIWDGEPPDGVEGFPATAQLYGFRDRRLLPGSPLRPSADLLVEPGERSYDALLEARGQVDASWNFELPLEWSAPGSLKLLLVVNPPGDGHWREISGVDGAANMLTLDPVRFQPIDPRDVFVYLADFYWRRGETTSHARPSLARLGRALDQWERMYPVPYGGLAVREIHVKRWAQGPCDGVERIDPVADFCSDPAVEGVPLWDNAIIAAEQAEAMARGREVFIPLLFDPSTPIGCSGRAGIGSPPMFHAGACGPTIAQEAAHSLGLIHLSNGHGEEGDGSGFRERSAGDHAELEAGSVGWDLGVGQPLTRDFGADGHRHDFMSYGWSDASGDAWVTLDTWQRVAAALRAANPVSARTGPRIRAVVGPTRQAEGLLLATAGRRSGAERSLLVSGTVAGGGEASIGRILRVEAPPVGAPAGSRYRLAVVDGKGEDLVVAGVAPVETAHRGEPAPFYAVVPWVDGGAKVELRRQGVAVAAADLADVPTLADIDTGEESTDGELFPVIRSPHLDAVLAPGTSARFDAALLGPDRGDRVAYKWRLDGEDVGDGAVLFLPAGEIGAHELSLRVVSGDRQGETSVPVVVDADGDHDGLGDAWEADHDLAADDPSDAASDTDGDGLVAWREQQVGSDPRELDSDGDRYTDPVEVAGGSDPADDGSIPQALHAALGEPVPRLAVTSEDGGGVTGLLLAGGLIAVLGGAGGMWWRRRRRA